LTACKCVPAPQQPAATPTKPAALQPADNQTKPVPATAPAPLAPSANTFKAGEWVPLFDGKSLRGWKETGFGGSGEVEVRENQIVLHAGAILTGIKWTNAAALPNTNYEIAYESMKVDGGDFFGALTFPVAKSHCTFVVGGWGGSLVGISSIDGMDASENETTKFMNFEKGKWYRIRIRVTPAKLNVWINDDQMVDQALEGRRISMRPGEIELSEPLGFATYQTTGALRDIKLRQLGSE
jgi:hypothetical protein